MAQLNAAMTIPAVPATPAMQARDISELYEIHDAQEIGKGAFSRVVVGTAKSGPDAGVKRAIKIMQMNTLNDRKVLSMMAHEKEILRRTRHPAILQLFQTIQTPERVYMVMELLKGDLFEFTVGRRRKLNEIQAAQVMKQLLSAVAYLHSINIVHRDIKLENILVNDWNDIRLADMGLSKIIREPPGAAIKNTPCGTGFYIAPEVISAIDSGYGGITALVTTHDKLKMLDLWSCGVTLFVLLSGRPPFSGQVKTAEERRDLLAKIDRGVLFPDQHWSHISAEAKDLISRLLTRDSSGRITAETAQMHPWFELQKRKLDEYYAHKAALAAQQAQPGAPIIVTPQHIKQGQEAQAAQAQAAAAAQQQQPQQQQQASKAAAVASAQQQQHQHARSTSTPNQPTPPVAVPEEAVDDDEAEHPSDAQRAQSEDVRAQMNALQGGLRDDAEAQAAEGGDGGRQDVQVVNNSAAPAKVAMAKGPPARRGGRGGGAQ